MLDASSFIICLLVFSALLFGVALYTKRTADYDSFFAAGRRISAFRTALTTTIAWMWADCLFSSSQIGYENGVYALVWFSVATTLGFVLFAWLARNVRDEAPHVITLPEYMDLKTGDSKSVHIVMAGANILYQVAVLGLNATITGLLLNTAFGFDYYIASASIVLLVLTYSMINGLKTSTVIGLLQMLFVSVIMVFLIAFLFMNAKIDDVDSLFGTNGVNSIFDTNMILSVGIPIAIIVITQPFVDQMIFQRLIALKKPKKIFKAFCLSGLLCGVIIFLLGTIGFVGHYLSESGHIIAADTQMVVLQTIDYYFSEWGVLLFLVAFFAVIFSTIDAGYCAVAALASIDVYKRYVHSDVSEKTLLVIGRISMIIGAMLAVLLALAKMKILWMLFIIGVIGGAMVAPIIFAMRVKFIDPRYVTASIIVALFISLPLSVYGNIVGNSVMVSGASIGSILIGALICYLGTKTKKSDPPG